MMRILHGLWQESKTGLRKERGRFTGSRQLGQALTNTVVVCSTKEKGETILRLFLPDGAHRIPHQIVFQIFH
jgi:hypothetical protein